MNNDTTQVTRLRKLFKGLTLKSLKSPGVPSTVSPGISKLPTRRSGRTRSSLPSAPSAASQIDDEVQNSASILTTAVTDPISLEPLQQDRFGDTRRTEIRYDKAVRNLKEALALPHSDWEVFQPPAFEDITNYDSLAQLQADVTRVLDTRQATCASPQNRKLWSLGKRAIERSFVAISPVAKNVLQILKEGSSVCLSLVLD